LTNKTAKAAPLGAAFVPLYIIIYSMSEQKAAGEFPSPAALII